jgi:hypothetical protein
LKVVFIFLTFRPKPIFWAWFKFAEKAHCNGIVAVNVIPAKFAFSEIFPKPGYTNENE